MSKNGVIAFENLGWHRERIIGYDEDVDVIKRDNPDAMIIFGTGCFDESHSGHEIFFEQMRRVGEDIDDHAQRLAILFPELSRARVALAAQYRGALLQVKDADLVFGDQVFGPGERFAHLR